MSIDRHIGRKFRFVTQTPLEINGNRRRIDDINKVFTILKASSNAFYVSDSKTENHFYFQCGGDIWFSSKDIKFIEDIREETINALLS